MPNRRVIVSWTDICLVLLVLVGCSGSGDDESQPAAAQPKVAANQLSTSGFRIDSASFQEKVRPYVRIPPKQTCFEGNLSPALIWTETPGETRSLALIAEDVDHQAGNWVHWVLYNIPGGVAELAEGIPTSTEVLPDGTTQGVNDNKNIGYEGPCPLPNIGSWYTAGQIDPPHRYFFRLYALDADLDLPPGATKADLLDAMEGHILAQANTMGKYTRPLELQEDRDVKAILTQTAIAGPSPTPTP